MTKSINMPLHKSLIEAVDWKMLAKKHISIVGDTLVTGKIITEKDSNSMNCNIDNR